MTERRTVYLYPDDLERLRVLRGWYGLGTSAATRAGLALLLAHLQDEDEEAKRHALDTTVGPVRREKEMEQLRVDTRSQTPGVIGGELWARAGDESITWAVEEYGSAEVVASVAANHLAEEGLELRDWDDTPLSPAVFIMAYITI